MNNFVIWQFQSVPHSCLLKNLTGVDQKYTLFKGIPLAQSFSKDAAFHMDPDFPKDLLLTDNLANPLSCMVVSARLAGGLRDNRVEHLEYLPVAIVDHKGKVASKDYFILNPLDLVDCIDRKKSKFKASAILPDEITRFEKLVIEESAVPEGRQLFRMKGFGNIALVGKTLADSLAKGKFTGLGWRDISKYPKG